ncbi:MAG: DUF805 domain-containing protein, partial [Actinomycetales bacterium]
MSAPYYGASLPIAFTRFWRKYATFSGRAGRSEFWWWELVGVIIAAILMAIYLPSLLASITGGHGIRINTGIVIVIVLGGIVFLATVVPSLALSRRRLHDVNLSGWFVLLSLVPSVGGLIVLILCVLPSNPEG